MAQPSLKPHHLSDVVGETDNLAVLCLLPPAVAVLSEFPARPVGRQTADTAVRVKSRLKCQVVVIELVGRLGDVVEDLDQAIELALADLPRGVVCDLSAVVGGAEPAAFAALASVGRHARDWPGIPVALACQDPDIIKAMRAHRLGRHLIVTSSILSALSAVLATPTLAVEWLRLAPHPTAPRASRNFVARTLLDWGLDPLIRAASLVVSELVTSSTIQAGTDMDLSVAWSRGALRLTVRDDGPELPRQLYPRLDEHGRGLSLVGALSRTLGVLPTADGGKVVWAVLNHAKPRPRIQRPPSQTCHDKGVPHVDRP